MKAIILSDTHNILTNAKTALNKFYEEIDAIFHLGDYYDDAETLASLYPDCRLFAVSGNCDFHSMEPSTKTVEFSKTKIFMSHGHPYGVKYDINRIYYAAREVGAQLCLFGHTHQLFYNKNNDLTILNPGSISFPRGGFPSFAVIDFDNKLQCEIYYIKAGEIVPVQ